MLLDPRRRGGLRPGLQGQPAAADRRGRGGRRRRAVRRHHRRGGHRPRAARARGEGRSPSTRRRRACSGCRRRCPSPGRCSRPHLGPERVFALLSAQPAVIARLTATDRASAGHSAQGGPVEAGATANLCVFDPDRHDGGGPGALASRSRNTPYAGRTLRRRGAPHRAARRSGRDRRDGAAVSAASTGTATGRRAPGDRRRRRSSPARRPAPPVPRGHGRARLQHRHERLPGGDHRPVLRRAGDRLHQHPHRQLRHQRRRRRGRRAALPRDRGVRPGRRAVQLAGRPRASSPSCAATASRPSPASTRGAWPATSARPGAVPVRLRHGARGGAARRGRGRRRHRRASTWCRA